MKIAIIDTLGLCYDGKTLEKTGLGGSESAVIQIAKNLQTIGFKVTVFNNCEDGRHSQPGVYDGVRYIDVKNSKNHTEHYDLVVVSRTTMPFLAPENFPFVKNAKKKYLWFHDTFIEGDEYVEDLVVSGQVDKIFTLSDWHTTYILNANHGKKRNFEMLKNKVFQTRNGAIKWIDEVDLEKKDRFQFVYNASATKGLLPLVEYVWPIIKKNIPDAKLTVIGGYYRFREGANPDEQENTVNKLANRKDLLDLDITFTGVIPQPKIAEILANAYMMIYPTAFPETFGISSVESLLYRTPIATCRFGALEETAINLACIKKDYTVSPNAIFPDFNEKKESESFAHMVLEAWNNPYLIYQKQNYCSVIDDIHGWDSVALEWKQFFYSELGKYLPIEEYRKVTKITNKVSRIFGRTNTLGQQKKWETTSEEKPIIIISPFYNARKYLENHIRSVASQDYSNYHHILIDDASTDGSLKFAKKLVKELGLSERYSFIRNETRKGCIQNQFNIFTDAEYVQDEDIIVLLDGDDSLINNNTIFKYINELHEDYDFTYGSMWSQADNIPLIAQDYPESIKKEKAYRSHNTVFPWKIPYTHLRTLKGFLVSDLNEEKFKTETGWMMSGADNPLFYETIEKCDPKRIFCNKEILVNYNDENPLNDYKINGEEQNKNAYLSYNKGESEMKKILIGIPTNKYIEPETVKSLWDMEIPDGYRVDFQYFYGYQIDQIRNLMANWGRNYDYLFCIDSDIVVPKNTLKNFIQANVDIISGVYIQRTHGIQTPEVYMDTPGGGCTNIPLTLLEDNLGVTEIAACGMGCCLIKGDVLRSMDYPHYHYKSALNHSDTVSEDVFFCMKAREMGFKVWVDTSIKCDHIGQYTFTVEDPALIRYRDLSRQDLLPHAHKEYLANLDISPKVIYDIGSSVLHWSKEARNIWPSANFILFDALETVGTLYEENGFKNYYLGVLGKNVGEHIEFKCNETHPGGNSKYPENSFESGFYFNDRHRQQRVTNTIDNIASLNNLPKPDLVKIDVQGMEKEILEGAITTFKNTPDIILELQHEDYNMGAPNHEEVIAYMKTLGYELVSNFTKTHVDGDYHFRLTTNKK